MIGGGLGGLAAAARLCKVGHDVTLVERTSRLGGVVHAVEHSFSERESFRWDDGPATMTLPAAARDLFRKSGRPLERALELEPVTTPRRHAFADGTVLDLPVGNRAGQHRALDAALGPAAAKDWQTVVDDLAPLWERLRTRVLEVPFTGGVRSLGPAGFRALASGRSLRSYARGRLRDQRARQLLEHLAVATGSDPGQTPALAAVQAYVERTFGLWTSPGGLTRLAEVLAERVHERGVDVRMGTEALGITTDGNGVSEVSVAGGDRLPADVVVAGVDVRTLVGELLAGPPRSLRRAARAIRQAPARTGVHLGLRGYADLPFETVFHGTVPGDPLTVIVRAPADPSLAPEGHRAVTVLVAGPRHTGGATDPLEILAARGLDLRRDVVARVDADPQPYGPVWRGWWRGLGVPTNQTAVRGLFVVGGSAHPGPGVPSVLLGAAAVAQLVGSAR